MRRRQPKNQNIDIIEVSKNFIDLLEMIYFDGPKGLQATLALGESAGSVLRVVVPSTLGVIIGKYIQASKQLQVGKGNVPNLMSVEGKGMYFNHIPIVPGYEKAIVVYHLNCGHMQTPEDFIMRIDLSDMKKNVHLPVSMIKKIESILRTYTA